MSYDVLDSKVRGGRKVARGDPLVGGVNNRYQPQYLADGECVELQNVELDDVTEPTKRDGFSATTNTQGALTATTNRPSGLFYFNPSITGSRKIVMPVNGDNGIFYAVSTSAAWSEALTGAAAAVDPATDDCVMAQGNDSMIFLRGASANVFAMDAAGVMYDGGNTDDSAPTTLGSPPRGGVDCCYFLNRYWILVGGEAPVRLCYSQLQPTGAGVATQWGRTGVITSTLAGRLLLSPNRGGQAVAVRPWNQTSLIVFYTDSVEEIIVNAADPATSSTRRVIEPRYGCVCRESIVSVGQDMYFMDQYGQYRSLVQTVNGTQAGVDPLPLSEKIKANVPGTINTAQYTKVRATAFKDKIYLAIPHGSATDANMVWIYDLGLKLWYGPQLWGRPIGYWMVSNIAGSGDELFFSNGTSSPGTEVTTVYRCYRGTFTDDGEPITYSFTTRAYDFGCPENGKTPRMLEVDFRTTAGGQLRVDMMVDEDGVWNALGTIAAASSTSSYPLTFPLVFPLVGGEPELQRARLHLDLEELNFGTGRFHRFRFRDTSASGQASVAGYRFIADINSYEMEEGS